MRPPGKAPPQLLVVEDHGPLREFILMALEPLELAVQGCASADEALAWLHGRPLPALLITDLMLPGRSGLELVEALRAQTGAGALPVLLMTAAQTLPGPERLRALGITAVLRKPMAVAALHDAVTQALAGTDGPAAEPTPPPARAAAEDERSLAGRHFMGDLGLYRRFRRGALARLPEDLAAGQAALAGGDGPALRRVAHDLKGLAHLLGADEVQALARTVETEAEAWAAGRGGPCPAAWGACEAAARRWAAS